MSRVTFDLSPELISQLAAATGGVEGERNRFVEEAITEKLKRDAEGWPSNGEPADWKPFPNGKTLLDMMADIVGKYEGPGDLSYNPKYLEGVGED